MKEIGSSARVPSPLPLPPPPPSPHTVLDSGSGPAFEICRRLWFLHVEDSRGERSTGLRKRQCTKLVHHDSFLPTARVTRFASVCVKVAIGSSQVFIMHGRESTFCDTV